MPDTPPPVEWTPHEIPALLIGIAARQLARINEERLRPLGLAIAQIPVVVALKDGAAIPQKELARIAGVEQPSMAQLLARMERDGLIARAPNPDDGRSSLVSLTPKAMAQLDPGRRMLLAGNADALRGMTPAEVESFTALLQRVIANLSPQAEPGP
ncbi:MarR family transcriptional regulator [Sphingomonas sp. dw_22]|uniref:MarR family winged helix-turn-helix transcriptional regulator n=1 Tax=Sphingomonas sp. dw_22 TaxID=2721175 RepID=UPI001BD4D11C|nr:MarR family transcriptional regulator [Sphingomonas sp. dw_22]